MLIAASMMMMGMMTMACLPYFLVLIFAFLSPQNPDNPDAKMTMMQKLFLSRRALPMGLLVGGGSVDALPCFLMCLSMAKM